MRTKFNKKPILLILLLTISVLLNFQQVHATGNETQTLTEEVGSDDNTELEIQEPNETIVEENDDLESDVLNIPNEIDSLDDESYQEPQTFQNVAITSSVSTIEWIEFVSTDSTINIFASAEGNSILTYIIGESTTSGVVPVLDKKSNRTKLIISGVIGWVDNKHIKIHAHNNSISYNTYDIDNGVMYHRIAKNPANRLSQTWIHNGPSPSFLKETNEVFTKQYLSFDGEYFYANNSDSIKKMISDYNSGSRNNAINKNAHYNYFQFLSVRSQSRITEADMRDYLRNRDGVSDIYVSRLYGNEADFIRVGSNYGGNHALTFSTAIHESNFGKSNYAVGRNNFFGHNAQDSNPNLAYLYEDAFTGVNSHFQLYYNYSYLNPESTYYNGGYLGNKASGMNVSYASDPYWGEKIAAHYARLDSVSGNKDYLRYTIVKVSENDVNIRKNPTTQQANAVYKTSTRNTFLTVVGTSNGESVSGDKVWYQILSDPILDKNKNVVAMSKVNGYKIDYKNNVLYVSRSVTRMAIKGVDANPMLKQTIYSEPKSIILESASKYQTKKNTVIYSDIGEKFPLLLVPNKLTVNGRNAKSGYTFIQFRNTVGQNMVTVGGYVKTADLSAVNGPLLDQLPSIAVTPFENVPIKEMKFVFKFENHYLFDGPITFRKGTSTQSEAIASYPTNTRFNGVDLTNGWTRTTISGKTGHFLSKYVRAKSSLFGEYVSETTPPVTPPENNEKGCKPENDKRGHVSCGPSIQIQDVMMVRYHLQGRKKLTSHQFRRAKVTSGKTIVIDDVMLIRYHVQGKKLLY